MFLKSLEFIICSFWGNSVKCGVFLGPLCSKIRKFKKKYTPSAINNFQTQCLKLSLRKLRHFSFSGFRRFFLISVILSIKMSNSRAYLSFFEISRLLAVINFLFRSFELWMPFVLLLICFILIMFADVAYAMMQLWRSTNMPTQIAP